MSMFAIALGRVESLKHNIHCIVADIIITCFFMITANFDILLKLIINKAK